MRQLAIAMCAAIVALCSCQPPQVDEDAGFIAIDPDGWKYGQRYEFTPALTDSVGNVQVAIAIRHNNDYPYSNLWLELTAPLPGTDSVRTDTFDIPIADVYGRWYGRGAAMSYIVVDTLDGVYHYDVSRPFSLRHIMRTDTLTDITQVGLIFNSAK